MTHMFSARRVRCGMVLLFVAVAHLLIFRALGGRASGRPQMQERIQWIEARSIVAPPPPVAVAAARVTNRGPATMWRPSAAPVVSNAISVDSPRSPAPSRSSTPSLDLSPETLGSLLDKARRGDAERTPPQSWRATARDEFAPVRQSETVGASGSRTTRVEGPLGTYCIRLPQPGRPPPSGAGPEGALPTNCP